MKPENSIEEEDEDIEIIPEILVNGTRRPLAIEDIQQEEGSGEEEDEVQNNLSHHDRDAHIQDKISYIKSAL